MDDLKIFKILKNFLLNHQWDEFKNYMATHTEIDVNYKDNENNYLINYAVEFNKLDIVDLLLQSGARIDIIDANFRSILYTPITMRYDEILKKILIYNKKLIGISIIDMRDKYEKIPLHFAIKQKNYVATKLLVEGDSNLNIRDNDGNDAMHLAVNSEQYEVCILINQYSYNINSLNNNGESSLHLAVNLKLFDICKLLISAGINVNIQNKNFDLSVLHYAVSWNYDDIIDLLVNSNIDVNLQDIYGNTALHYAINYDNYDNTKTLLKNEKANYNLWNIEGEIPLMIYLQKIQETQNTNDINNTYDINNLNLDILQQLIDKSNLAIQDKNGNTPLHLLIKLNIWKNVKDNLNKKKIKFQIKNKEGISPIDYLDDQDIEEFIKIITNSYMYRLKLYGNQWNDNNENFDNICSKEFINLTILEKKAIKASDQQNFEGNCYKIFYNKIKESIMSNNKTNNCFSTYPIKKNKKYLKKCPLTDSNYYNDVDFSTFTGNTLEVLIGLIYILQKYKFVGSPISKNHSDSKNICNFYKSVGIFIKSKCEFFNFELIWAQQKLYLIDSFMDNFQILIKNKRYKFVIIPIGIELKNGSHSNYLVYDIANKEMERFEPHGSAMPINFDYNQELLDNIIHTKFKEIDEDIKYFAPITFLPKVSFQLFDAFENNHVKIGDPGGFCAIWNIWYIDMRMSYLDINRKKLIGLLIKNLKLSNISFKKLIRNYAQKITKIRDNLLKKVNLDINDWINDQFTDQQMNKLMDIINQNIKSAM